MILTRLLIAQPYVPAYRVPLFEKLKELLAAEGIQLAIAAAEPSGKDLKRGDDRTLEGADFNLRSRQFTAFGKSVLYRDLARINREFQPDLLIVEQAIKNVESWFPLIKQGPRQRMRVAMWGHGKSYSTSQSPLEAELKQWLTRRADWFFAYTTGGADYVVARGFPRNRTTVLWNSTDTRTLQMDLAGISRQEAGEYCQRWGLMQGKTALFLGGLDDRKGIPFLLESARSAAALMPGFTLLVAGAGAMEDLVLEEQAQGGPVRMLGRVEGRQKALALASADILMVPEWVGLVAVDALASGKPLVTTNHDSHSPEFEYLTPGETAVFTDHRVDAYVAGVVELLSEPSQIDHMSASSLRSAANLSIENMASHFADGIGNWLSMKLRRS